MTHFDFVADAIREELEKLKGANPSYSLRSFARRMGMSPTAVSEIIRGKRPVTRKTAQIFIDKIKLEPLRVKRIQKLLLSSSSASSRKMDIRLIREMVKQNEAVWNRHDTRSLALFWTTDGCLIEPWGLCFDGRKAIEKFYEKSHSTYLKNASIKYEIKSLAFASATVAFLDLNATIFNMKREQDAHPSDMHLAIPATVVKRKGAWRFMANRPYVLLPPSSVPWGNKPPK